MKKDLLTADQLIEHMKSKGITFHIISEDEAKDYLENNNNYFKLASYRKNYSKHPAGKCEGEYVNLDFAYLKDLAIIDMTLRYTIVHMALDIEHHTKLEILRSVEMHEKDGYTIVKDYFDSLSSDLAERARNEIKRNKNSIYARNIIEKYGDEYPVWAFLEIIPFGQLLSFYSFCASRYNDKTMKDNYYRLKTCKEIRNASAHSNCILNDLHGGNTNHKTNNKVAQALMNIPGLSKNTRVRKMKNARIQQIITVLYVYADVVKSEGIKEKTANKLFEVLERMNKHIEYYDTNDMIRTSFKFIECVVRDWFLTEE